MTARLSYPDHKADLCEPTSIYYAWMGGGPRIPTNGLYLLDCDVRGAGLSRA